MAEKSEHLTKNNIQAPDGAGTARSRAVWWGVLVFVAAFVVRALYLYQSRVSPTFSLPIVDAAGYDGMARFFAEQGVMKIEFFWQQFFYPLFLSVVYRLSGSSILVAKLIQILLGSVTCVLVYILARRIFDLRSAVAAGLMMAFYGPLIFHEVDLIPAGWVTFWTVVIMLVLLEVRRRKTPIWFAAFGLCGGLCVITRPNFLPFLAAASVWLIWSLLREESRRSRALLTIMPAVFGFCAIVLPVSAVNTEVTGKFGFLPASGGLNMYIGNHPDFDAATVRPGISWKKIIDLPSQHDVENDMWASQKYFYNAAFENIRSKPKRFLAGLRNKTMHLLSSREMPGNVDVYLFRRFSPLLAALIWKAGPFGFPFVILLPLAAVGLLWKWRQAWPVIPLFLLLYAPTIILAHIESRYRMPLIVPMAIMAGAGLFTVADSLKRLQWRSSAAMLLCMVLMALVSSIPGPFVPEGLDLEAEVYYCAGWTSSERGDDSRAKVLYEKALAVNDDYPNAHIALGMLLAKEADYDTAIRHYQRALEIAPDAAVTHYNLANALYIKQQFNQAIVHYSRAVQLSGYFADAYTGLGTTQFMLGDLQSAAANLEKAMACSKEHDKSDVAKRLVSVLFRLGRLEEAAKLFVKILETHPEDKDARFNLGVIYVQTKKIDKAHDQFIKLVEQSPEKVEYHTALAGVLLMQGKIEQSASQYRQVLRLDPNNPIAQRKLLQINQVDRK